MSVLNTKGIKKLNKVRSTPNSNPPIISDFLILLFCFIYLLNQTITLAKTIPVNTTQKIVSAALSSKEE